MTLVEAALEEVAGAAGEPRLEVARMLQLQQELLNQPDTLGSCDACAEEGRCILTQLSVYR